MARRFLALALLIVASLGGARAVSSPASSAALVEQARSPLPCVPSFSEFQLLLQLDREMGPDQLASADFNDDGLTDLFAATLRLQMPDIFEVDILVNDGEGHLVDATHDLFLGTVPKVQHPREIVLADFNGDQRPDIFVADHGQDVEPWPGYQNTLILSAPNGKLVDATANLPQQSDYAHSATAADIDGDGDVDLYVGNWVGEVFLNDRWGSFSKATGRLPPLGGGAWASCQFADLDNDEDQDLVVGFHGDGRPALLWNDGTGHFSLGQALPPKPWRLDDITLDIQAEDITGDGYLDLFLSHTKSHPFYHGRYIQILINNRDRTFRDETATRLPQSDNLDGWIRFLQVLDMDYDGDLDLVAEIMGEPPLIYLNRGARFEQWSHGLDMQWLFELMDVDADGRRDVVIPVGWGTLDGYSAAYDIGCPLAFLPVVSVPLCAGGPPTPTPIPPFSGLVQIYEVYNGMDGWGWPPGAPLKVDILSSSGSAKASLTIVVDANGTVPFTHFGPADLKEGDRVSLSIDQQSTAFPVRMVRATADPECNTIVGIARCYARVTAMVEHPAGTYTSLETTAGADGSFFFDYSGRVDWDYGDSLWVGQYLNANGLVMITEDSPELVVIRPATTVPVD